MTDTIPILKCGYIKLNTSYIPQFLSYNKVNTLDNKVNFTNFYIKSSEPINLEIGGVNYTLNSGENYLPNIYTFHPVKILNNNNCEIYNNCLSDIDYFQKTKILFNYYIFVPSMYKTNDNNKLNSVIFYSGMCGDIPNEKLNNIPNNILNNKKLSN